MTYNDFIRQIFEFIQSNPSDDELLEKRDAIHAFVEKATTKALIRDANYGIRMLEEELFDRQFLSRPKRVLDSSGL